MLLKDQEPMSLQSYNNGNVSLPEHHPRSLSWVNDSMLPVVAPSDGVRGINQNANLSSPDAYDCNNPPEEYTENRGRVTSSPVEISNSDSSSISYQENKVSAPLHYKCDNSDSNSKNDLMSKCNSFYNKCDTGLPENQKHLFRESYQHSEAGIDAERVSSLSPTGYDYSTDEGLFEYEDGDQSCSSAEVSPQDEDERMFDVSDSEDSYSNGKPHPIPRGIHNPNYPGFQHLAYTLQEYSIDSPDSFENNSVLSNIDNDDSFKDELNLKSNGLSAEKKQEILIESNNNEYILDGSLEFSEIDEHTERSDDFQKPQNAASPKLIKRSDIIFIPQTKEPKQQICISSADYHGQYANSLKTFPDEYLDSPNDETHRCTLDENVNSIEDYCVGVADKSIATSDFHDDLIALQREIYETIQVPIANTLENITEVVNSVIVHIVDQQNESEIDGRINLRKNYDSNKLTIEKCIPKSYAKEKYGHSEVIADLPLTMEQSNSIKNCSDTLNMNSDKATPIGDDVDKVKNIDDAYLSTASENITQNSNLSVSPKEMKSKDREENGLERLPICKEETNPAEEGNEATNGNPNDDKSKWEIDNNFNRTAKIEHCRGNKKIYSTKSGTEDIKSPSHCCPEKDSSGRKKSFESKSSKILHRKLVKSPLPKDTHKGSSKKKSETSDGFDVYNIETAMPHIDLDAIECHLRAAREEERRRRNDREEIRRRLAMGGELDEFYVHGDRPGRKPSLQSRLKSGMNLQICFMNETASDTESPLETDADDTKYVSLKEKHSGKEIEKKSSDNYGKSSNGSIKTSGKTGLLRPSSLALNETARPAITTSLSTQADFFACQARLQTEARMALAQAKEMAHLQMEIERQRLESSPITEMLRSSLEKAGVQFPGDRRRVSRQMLTDMNVAQLQIIVNELHTQIEFLNESLVKLLIARDELHMSQDSMLVDIEDLTRHLGAKELNCKTSDIIDDSSKSNDLEKRHLLPQFSLLTSLLTK